MPDRYVHVPDLAAHIQIQPESIVSRTLYRSAGTKLVLFGMAVGQELSEHTASMPATIHILSGTARVTLGGEEFEAEPGAWFRMAAGLAHSVSAITPVVMLLTMMKGDASAS